jgi:hypothetical protein
MFRISSKQKVLNETELFFKIEIGEVERKKTSSPKNTKTTADYILLKFSMYKKKEKNKKIHLIELFIK